jgi:hypothetical protein
MGKMLSAAAIEQYRRDGYWSPLRVVSPEEAARYRARLESVERGLGGPLRGVYRIKPHLLFTWLADLVRHPAVLDAVEDVIGPDILCWNSSFFTKEAESPGYVSWHQDATYWGLSEPDVVTAWVAFTESTPRNGNMQVIPGSHRSQAAHVDTFHPDNLLSRGQEIAVEVDESQAADIVLAPGEMSLHHVLIVHGSRPGARPRRLRALRPRAGAGRRPPSGRAGPPRRRQRPAGEDSLPGHRAHELLSARPRDYPSTRRRPGMSR